LSGEVYNGHKLKVPHEEGGWLLEQAA